MDECDLESQSMIPSVASRWCQQLPPDAQATLGYAFRNALKCPWQVPEHTWEERKIGKRGVTLRWFRIGYTNFTIALADGYPPLIVDFALNDELSSTQFSRDNDAFGSLI